MNLKTMSSLSTIDQLPSSVRFALSEEELLVKQNSKCFLIETNSVSSDSVSELPSLNHPRKKHVILRLSDIRNHETNRRLNKKSEEFLLR
jgi:hypothetical protein